MTDRCGKACQDIVSKCTCMCVARSKMAKPAMFVLMCLLLVDVGLCTISVVDSRDDLGISHEGYRTGKSDKSEPSVSLMWGIADTTATVGRFFNYTIPHDAFNGNNLVYKVTEAGKDSLPRWLVFSPSKQLLQGLPTYSDIGQHYIEVVASGPKRELAKDIFSIFVNEDGGSPSTTLRFREKGPKTVRCKRSEPETAVSIVVDVDVDNLGAEERLGFLNKIVSHLNLGEDMLKITHVGSKPLNDASALVSGVGDAKTLQTPGSFVSWLVGCGKVEPDHMQVLQQVETDSMNGMMANAIGHPVHVWHVTNSRFQEHKRRKRQAIRATATPAVTPTLPVKGPTDTIRATGTEHDAMTRPVPTVTSPSFGIQPTKTVKMEKTVTPGAGGTPIAPTKAPDGIKPSVGMPDHGPMTKTQVLPTKTHVMTDEVVPTKTTPKPTDTEGEATKDAGGKCKDMMPVVTKKMHNMDYVVGDIIKYKIPQDTFHDCRVGNTRKLTLDLFINMSSAINKSYWISFDQDKQLIQGVPTKKDIGKHKFSLLARIKKGDITPAAVTSFNVIIKPDPNMENRNHELSMKMDYDFDTFNSNTDKQIMFMNKVARMYGDKVKHLSITNIAKGSTVVSWTNKTLASPGDCPIEEIKAMLGKIANDDGTPTDKAVRGMAPFVIKNVGAVPQGACEGNNDFPVLAIPTTGDDTDDPSTKDEDDDTGTDGESSTPEPGATTEGVKTGGVGGSSDDIWITTVVPAVVIVAILLLALLIACILYRKKRKGKMNLEDQNTFVNKGVPVIFQDELEEKPTDSTKPLLLEGQPPCPPPEYQRGDSQGSTPPVNHKQPQYDLDGDHIDDTNVSSPLYQPPPPVTASGGNNKPRPHVAQPAYRTQPPSIPP